jgi:phosphoenolpyruvate synthase/pyruvate phosphate dikinase
MNYSELDQVQKGDILVCPGTNPAWTPIFGLVKAVVSDRGGTLSHTAIVGREYGLPTLVNTFTATTAIKTGQMIRVDATEGALYILDK